MKKSVLDNVVLQKIKTNIIQMLKNRKIDVDNKMVYKTNHMYIPNDLYVRFILNYKVKPNEIKLNLDKILKKDIKFPNIILVLLDKPNNSILKAIKIYKKKHHIQVFWKDELIIDKVNHVLVPKHILINDSNEIDEILDKFQIKTINKLPFILTTDPISKYYDAKKGNVFKIIRNSVTSGQYISYRCVY